MMVPFVIVDSGFRDDDGATKAEIVVVLNTDFYTTSRPAVGHLNMNDIDGNRFV